MVWNFEKIDNLLKFEEKWIQKFENGLTYIVRKVGHFFFWKQMNFLLKRLKIVKIKYDKFYCILTLVKNDVLLIGDLCLRKGLK